MIRRGRARIALAMVFFGGCLWGGGNSRLEPVSDAEVLAFAERVGSFYGLLEGERLDVLTTYRDADLRGFFPDERAFSDYYALLAERVRKARFRHSTPRAVVVREFRVESSQEATVDVVLLGEHRRALKFWDTETRFTDHWVKRAGVWMLSPDKL